MKIDVSKISTDFNEKTCFVHARAAITDTGFGVMTTQPLLLTGCDVFSGQYLSFTEDFGRSWSALVKSKSLVRRKREDYEIVMSDGTPMFHKASGKIILLGHMVAYEDDVKPKMGVKRSTVYSIYDPDTKDFEPFREIEMPNDAVYFSSGNGSGQSFELENGEILIPIYFNPPHDPSDSYEKMWNACSLSAVMRCRLEGDTLKVIEIGNHLTTDVPRGIGEPSIIRARGKFFLALRNDVTGFVSDSPDGIHFSEPRELCFDNGENLGNYNTQQHWLTLGDKLYLVYTRRDASNEHIFRHRAPLFIAEFDTERLCVIRESERIAVPERGARLGNFGCTQISENEAIIVAAEWMQSTKGYIDHYQYNALPS